MKTMNGCILLLALCLTSLTSWAADLKPVSPDQRINLGLTEAEKANFLSEMRQMLTSIQGIVAGIAKEDSDQIIKFARYSGNRMARATPLSVKAKTPKAFKEIGAPTHMMFEELVIRAETDDMQTLTELTGRIMQQCLACHEMFKAN